MKLSGAFHFAILLGIVSLFGDMTYEAARSINGPYLAILGASATVVGFVAGLGELIGYGLRLISGYISDKTRRYWTITIFGYAVNLFAVPIMALAGRWEIAAILMIMERLGKAIRTPARDVMLSHAGSQIGSGWAFGIHEAMDQIGAAAGPLIVALVFYLKGSYKEAYAVLAIPAVLAMLSLLLARVSYPQPEQLEKAFREVQPEGMGRHFWLYIVAIAFIGAGYADYPLIAFHFKKTAVFDPHWIPLFYAAAMISDAVAALVFGKMFDRIGLTTVAFGVMCSLLFPPLVFFGNWQLSLIGMILWGIGMGMQESVMRAAIAMFTPPEKRGSAYGVFNMGFGLFWFIGSALMGALYDRAVIYPVIFSVSLQLISVILIFRIKKERYA